MQDTQYVAVSARIRAMEPTLVGEEALERLMEAKDNAEAQKLLREWGYPSFDLADPTGMDLAIAKLRDQTIQELTFGMPQVALLDVFTMEYDYHNAKALLKARAMGMDAQRMLSDLGRIPAQELLTAVDSGDDSNLPETFALAVQEAKEVLETTRDPQQADMVLDRWYYQELTAMAKSLKNPDLEGFVALKIDGVNLRTLVRTLRMGKSPAFLQGALISGGNVDEETLVRLAQNGGVGVEEVYHASVLEEAGMTAAAAIKGGNMTVFERACDNAVSAYWSFTQLKPFGQSVVLAYLSAKETEYLNVRIVLAGRGAHLSSDVIATRLRKSCL